ncbi:MAG: peptide deformylase [Spirochaetaceae bacterium]|jgi:peptide deformylase|nr:peptide deformylase [Spirochaetaceae bacterium]
MEILRLGNALLRQKAELIGDIDPEVQETAEKLIDLMHRGKGIGLAGPQVGLMKRIFAIHIEKDIPRIFINPSIIETSQELVKYEEGCLSVPGIWGEVSRPKNVRIQAWNEKGRPFNLEAGGLLARAILHEYDHLDGILFLDRLPDLKRIRLLAKFEKLQAKQGPQKADGKA